MSIGHRNISGRVGRSALATVLAAAFALALLTPALAVSGPTRLSSPFVSPRDASPSDVVSFAVSYRNREGSPPDEVRVVIDGVPSVMSSAPGDSTWKSGVRFTFATTLPVGIHAIEFSATDREKFTDQIDAGVVTVTVPPPPPTPTPTPVPTPPPTPVPTPTLPPSPAPTSGATLDRVPVTPDDGVPDDGVPDAGVPDAGVPGTGVPSGSPGGTDDLAPVRPTGLDTGRGGSGGSAPSGPDDAAAGPGGARGDPGDGGPPGSGSPGARDPGAPGGAGGDSTGGPSGSGGSGGRPTAGWGDLARALESLGVDSRNGVLLQVLPTVVGTTGGVALAMAFMFFGKKRRDGEPPAPDEVLHADAARGAGLPATAALVPGSGPTAPGDAEMLMPRWRRPSLLQARKADPLRDTSGVRPSLSFDHGLVGPVDGHERRVIRYRVVRLLDAPDELRSAEIGVLDQGDEVQLLERSGTYWLVLCPDGRRGWLHKMTLGDVVGDKPAPGARETWATESVDAGPGIDDDVLTAFLAARGRA